MKRELEADLGPDGNAFFVMARDVLHQLVLDEDGPPLADPQMTNDSIKRHRHVVKTLRAWMTSSRTLNRTLVMQPLLWQVLLPEARPGLSTGVWDQMHAGDMLRLCYVEYTHNGLRVFDPMARSLQLGEAMEDAQFQASLSFDTTPLRFLADLEQLMRQLVGDVVLPSHITARNRGYDALRLRLYDSPDPLGFCLALLIVAMQPYDPEGLVRLTPEDYASLIATLQGTFMFKAMNDIRRTMLGPLQRLFALWPSYGPRCNEALRRQLRAEIQCRAWRLQALDSPQTLVPRTELPWSYVLFWFTMMTRLLEVHPDRTMFHACVSCFEPLDAQSECCWHRDAPQELYCNAMCFTKHLSKECKERAM